MASKKENGKLIKDWINKINVTRKIVEDFKIWVESPKNLKILDVGSGNGGASIAFAEAGAIVSGIELNERLVDIAKQFSKEYSVKPNFILYNGNRIPFQDNIFDAALSISVLEHVSDPINYLKEILRVLKPNRYLYLAFLNRLWPKETHPLLYFLHWLPYIVSSKLVKLFKHCPYKDNNLYFYTYWDLKNIIEQVGSEKENLKIIEEKGKSKKITKKIIKKSLKMFSFSCKIFLPHIQLILKKTIY